MTRRKRNRLFAIGGVGVVLAAALALTLTALEDQVVFFRTPEEAKVVPPGERIRIGGLVAEGSVERLSGTRTRFVVTDTVHSVTVEYDGILPDLFREGQGVVAEGVVRPAGGIEADTVLARHDENYMPREVADALKAQGVWQHGRDAAGGADGSGVPTQ